MYSDLYINKPDSARRRRIAIAIIALVLAAGLAGYLVMHTPRTRASASNVITQDIVNVSQTQFGVFWKTDAPVNGSIVYGNSPDNLAKVAADERDTVPASFQSHLVTVPGLEPGRTYYFVIVSGSTWITGDNGKPFSVTLPRNPPRGSFPRPAYGKVTLESGIPVDSGIVLLRMKNSYPLAVRTRRTGEWLMPLQNIYDRNSNEPVGVSVQEQVRLEIVDATLQRSEITADISLLSPLPETVIIGKSYSFLKEGSVLSATDTRASELPREAAIQFPSDGAFIPAGRPLLKGTADPGARVTLEISAEPLIRLVTRADTKGNWRASLAKPLPPDTYTLTMRTVRDNGESAERQRTFTIAKSGEMVLGEATGSASPAPGNVSPTLQPTIEPTSEPTPEPTRPLPTRDPADTETELSTPSASVSPVSDASSMQPGINGPSATPVPPVSGANGTSFTLVSIGLLILGAGALVFL